MVYPSERSTMDYTSSIEWAEDNAVEWTATQAAEIIADHGITDTESLADFVRTCGDRNRYEATAVLRWLGY
jgi:hypothetical protein